MSQNPQTAGETAPAQTITDFESMTARHVGGHDYVVTNRASGSANEVNLREMTCTCEDMEYNQHGEGACKHYFYAHHASPKVRLSVEDGYTQDMARLLIQLRETVADAQDAAAQFEGGLIAQRDAEADTAAQTDTTASQSTQDESPPGEDIDVQGAAERLQSAFDDVIDDMQVQAHEGFVWFQTGRDTPDDWPFPGGDETFNVVTGPDYVMYVHDGSADWADSPHKHYDKKPGEWWKNALAPEAVDEYIQEVLE